METIKTHNICFLGQTGFGKSSLINALFGAHFCTDPLVSCTKELYSVMVMPPQKDNEAILVMDTPGIGEFSDNSKYQLFYNYAVSMADHIVLVVSLDRTDSTSQGLLESLRPFVKNENVKFTIALNRIDSSGVQGKIDYVAWDANSNTPSQACLDKVNRRVATIHENFDGEFLPFEVMPVCAIRNYGLDRLRERILL